MTVLRELYDRNRTLCVVTVANFALAVVFTALMALDGRTLLGRNVWTKPWKFATSIAIFTATMAWILPSLSLSDRAERAVTATIGGAMTIEIVLISIQAARGVRSHFNTSSSVDSTIFMIMGITITLSSVAVAYALWRVVRNPPPLPPAYRWGIVLGMSLFVIASFQGWLMIAQEGHSVGAPNDAPGLPLLNWSLIGGDLRVAHFIGLHALQVLPLTGYFASRWNGGSSRWSLTVVGLAGTLYTLFIGLTFLQALRGTPFVGAAIVPTIAPSVFAACLLLISVVCVILLAVIWRRHTAVEQLPAE